MIETVKNWGRKIRLERPPSSGMPEAIQWLMLARLLVAFAILGIVVLLQVQQGSSPEVLIPLYTLLASAFAFNLLTLAVVDRLPDALWVSASQIFYDTLLISLGIALAPGKVSVFALFYLVQILCCSLIFLKRGAWLAALGAAAGFGFVQLKSPGAGAFLDWAIFSALFATLGFVGGYLSEELLQANRRLEQKRRRIQKVLALHERILSDLPTGLLTLDGAGRVGYVNPAGAHILGRESDQITGQQLEAIEPGLLPFFEKIEAKAVGSETQIAVAESKHSYFLQARSEHGLTRLQQKVEIGRGKTRRVLRGDVAQIEADAELEGVLGSGAKILLFQDVTSLMRLEEKLKQSEKLAAVGQLAAGIAHEIRNPLASMSASIEMLKSSVSEKVLGEENHRLMDIAIREIERLNRLISEFLDFVKPEKFKFAEVDLSALLSEICLSARSLKEVRGRIEFVEKYETFAVKADSSKLKQVIWNLVMNAIQAMPGPGRVEVGCRQANARQGILWVEDEGQGMSEEVLSHLYEPFFTTKDRGTGLGLATAYKIVESHYGEIRVQSRVGQGTRFEIWLPLA